MKIKEAHEKAVQGDRMLIVQGEVSGVWYQDHILDFVAEHGEDECILLLDGEETVTVERSEEWYSKIREEITNAVRNLGYKEGTFVHIEQIPENPVRIVVELNGEHSGIYDLEKHTFVD